MLQKPLAPPGLHPRRRIGRHEKAQPALVVNHLLALQQELPAFFNTISLLGIGFEELSQRYATFKAAPGAPVSLASSHEKQ